VAVVPLTNQVGGKICRSGQLLPGCRTEPDAGKTDFIGFFCMARRLLRNRHTN